MEQIKAIAPALEELAKKVNTIAAAPTLIGLFIIFGLFVVDAGDDAVLVSLFIFWGITLLSVLGVYIENRKIQRTTHWSRPLVRQPIPQEVFQEILNKLNEIKLKAQDYLMRTGEHIDQTNRVRTNIFLADLNDATKCDPIRLKIVEGLAIDMDKSELDIVFRPNEGLSGFVYVVGASALTHRKDNFWEKVRFDQLEADACYDYRLNHEQLRLINKDLMWVIGFPIKVLWGAEKKEITIGVVNLDGINLRLPVEKLRQLKDQLEKEIDSLSDIFSKCSYFVGEMVGHY